jgi:hypothetical protein
MDGFLDWWHRFGSDLVDRTTGPMVFRLILQPLAAVYFAWRDGVKDARAGRSLYLYRLEHGDLKSRRATLIEGVTSVARVLVLGVVMDVVYQFRVYGAFKYPLEAFVVAVGLAFLPYLILRGPFERLERRRLHKARVGGK